MRCDLIWRSLLILLVILVDLLPVPSISEVPGAVCAIGSRNWKVVKTLVIQVPKSPTSICLDSTAMATKSNEFSFWIGYIIIYR